MKRICYKTKPNLTNNDQERNPPLTKRMEKMFDSSYTRIQQAILNKSWSQHPAKQQLYGHLTPHHHHHIALVARISLTLSRHSSLSFITLGRSSGQHPVSSHSCWMYVRAGRLAFARPCVGVHKSTSLMSSSLLLQQCPACRKISKLDEPDMQDTAGEVRTNS